MHGWCTAPQTLMSVHALTTFMWVSSWSPPPVQKQDGSWNGVKKCANVCVNYTLLWTGYLSTVNSPALRLVLPG